MVQKWSGYCNVALQANAGYSLSQALNIAIKQGCDESARHFPKYPVVSVVVIVNLQSQGKQQQQVGQGQVQKKHYCGHGLGF